MIEMQMGQPLWGKKLFIMAVPAAPSWKHIKGHGYLRHTLTHSHLYYTRDLFMVDISQIMTNKDFEYYKQRFSDSEG